MNEFQDTFTKESLLQGLLDQAIQRRPSITALALLTPGGRLWAATLPDEAETESVAAIAASVALLGRRVSLEQLGADMRQVYVEGVAGYTILRTIDDTVVLLAVAASDANLALVLHDVDQIEKHVSSVMGFDERAPSKWAQAGPAIERLRRLVGHGLMPGETDERLRDLGAKLDSLDMGFFPERVAAIRASLNDADRLGWIEAEMMALELDVMAAMERPATPSPTTPVSPPDDGQEPVARAEPVLPDSDLIQEPVDEQASVFRRALKWLASMIESED